MDDSVKVNWLAPGRFQWNFRWIIFKIILEIGGWGISYEIALTWISLYLTDDKSTLVQVMTWCPQAASHYLNKCRPRSMSTCGVPGPQWVDIFLLFSHCFLNHFTPQYPQLACLSTQPLYSLSISTSSVTCSSSTTSKHYLKMLSSKTNALLTHTLASFWRKQSCFLLALCWEFTHGHLWYRPHPIDKSNGYFAWSVHHNNNH